MRTSQAGMELIKRFEGCRLEAYLLPGEKYHTIGYGHSYDPSVTAGTVWTAAQAEAALRVDLARFEAYVEKDVPYALAQPQFDALVSYAYNRGEGGLRQLVGASRLITDYPDNIVKYWGTAMRYREGLVRRRRAEAELFRSGTKSAEEIAQEAMDGKWGDGLERKRRIEKAGYDYAAVQEAVNASLNR